MFNNRGFVWHAEGKQARNMCLLVLLTLFGVSVLLLIFRNTFLPWLLLPFQGHPRQTLVWVIILAAAFWGVRKYYLSKVPADKETVKQVIFESDDNVIDL